MPFGASIRPFGAEKENMDYTLNITGKSELKGRNGYCSLGKATTITLADSETETRTFIDFYSKRGSDEPPARIIMSLPDALAFQAWITAQDFTAQANEALALRSQHECNTGRYGTCA